MTDNSYELYYPPYLNNPKSCPKSTNAYLPDVLSETQQPKMDNAKIKMAKHNQKYLGAHPEIKAIVSLILRDLFVHRPVNIHEHVGKFVRREKFPVEIAQFLVEQLDLQFSDLEDDEDPKAPDSMETTHDPRLSETRKVSTVGEHRFLKKMLYGADPHNLRQSLEQHDSMHVALSYDQLLKIMRSGSSVYSNNNLESAVASALKKSDLDEEEEDEEEAISEETLDYGDNEDNEEALLEGQRLIFAMLGKKLTPSSSTSDLSLSDISAGHTKRGAGSLFGDGADGTVSPNFARLSVYSTYDPAATGEISPGDEDEDEEYFDKD